MKAPTGHAAYRGLAALALLVALVACTAKHQAAASGAAVSDAVAAEPPLRGCETRSFSAGDGDVTVLTNADGSVGSVTVQSADPAVRAQVLAELKGRFGPVKHDPRVFTHPNKWGLNVMLDACGRTLDLSGSARPSATP